MAKNDYNPFGTSGDGNSDNHGSDTSTIPDYGDVPF